MRDGRKLHLIVDKARMSTFRTGKKVDSHDIHFALRVTDYFGTLKSLLENGYHPEAEDELKRIKVSPRARAGFPQIFILDPDRNVIELSGTLTDDQVQLVEAELAKTRTV